MKRNTFFGLALALAATVHAQTNAPVAPAPTAPPALSAAPTAPAVPSAAAAPVVAAPAPAPSRPAARPAPRPARPEPRVSLVPGPATVDASNVNVRGRATLLGEVVAQLNKGDVVTVIEQLENPVVRGDDRRQWARIAYPANTPVWVFGAFVSADGKVATDRLNLRAGPGENYSIVGRLTRNTAVKEIKRQGEWIAIEAPAEATAFVAATFLKQGAPALAAAPPQPAGPAPAPTTAPIIEPASTNVVTELEPVTPAPTDTATAQVPVSDDLAQFLAGTTGGQPPVEEPEEPLPPRIVMREGVVSGNTSIQAPSFFALRGLDTGRTINYLYTTSTNVNLARYVGLRIVVTGEESLDPRWPNTPVITIQRIQVVE
ncbi:MAG: SH3 domain-containing protein [Limisphaerales bacterium]